MLQAHRPHVTLCCEENNSCTRRLSLHCIGGIAQRCGEFFCGAGRHAQRNDAPLCRALPKPDHRSEQYVDLENARLCVPSPPPPLALAPALALAIACSCKPCLPHSCSHLSLHLRLHLHLQLLLLTPPLFRSSALSHSTLSLPLVSLAPLIHACTCACCFCCSHLLSPAAQRSAPSPNPLLASCEPCPPHWIVIALAFALALVIACTCTCRPADSAGHGGEERGSPRLARAQIHLDPRRLGRCYTRESGCGC